MISKSFTHNIATLWFCAILLFTNQIEGKVYDSKSYQIDFPDTWSTVSLPGAGYKVRAYTYLGPSDFLCIEVGDELFIERKQIQAIINSFDNPKVQEKFKNWLISCYEKYFENIEIAQMDLVLLDNKTTIFIHWKGIAKNEIIVGKKGHTIYFSEYFLPHPNNWLRSLSLIAYSTLNDCDSQLVLQGILQSFVVKTDQDKG